MVGLLHVHICRNTDSHALTWPRLSHILTLFPRRPQHSLSQKAAFLDMEPPLAPELPTLRNRTPTSNQGKTAKLDGNQEAPSRIAVSPARPQDHPHNHHQTWDLDLDQKLNLGLDVLPHSTERPVAVHAQCRITADSVIPAASTADLLAFVQLYLFV